MSTDRSTGRATPLLPGCPMARRSTTSGDYRRMQYLRVRSSSTGGSTCTGSAPTLRRTSNCSAMGSRRRTTTGCMSVGTDAGSSSPPRRERHRATTCGSRIFRRPPQKHPSSSRSRSASTPGPTRTWAETEGCTSGPTGTPRVVGSRSPTRPDLARRHGRTCCPKTPRPYSRTMRSSTVSTARCCWRAGVDMGCPSSPSTTSVVGTA